ncbi:hypothetical protein KKC17_03420 [Patescibacteria group bacterium]|nr:hypothetical protein [Patescibacteria group bacterium]
MNKTKHLIIYSHGFGVQKDERGMFTELAQVLPEAEHIMFDYNLVNKAQNTLTLSPLDKQVEILAKTLKQALNSHLGANISLIAHSQGCLVAAMLKPMGLSQAIFLNPPFTLDDQRTISNFKNRPGCVIDMEGVSKFPRLDGTTTLVPKEYWQSRQGINPVNLYNDFVKLTDLAIITAKDDKPASAVPPKELDSKIKVLTLPGGHNFDGEYRAELLKTVKSIFLSHNEK